MHSIGYANLNVSLQSKKLGFHLQIFICAKSLWISFLRFHRKNLRFVLCELKKVRSMAQNIHFSKKL